MTNFTSPTNEMPYSTTQRPLFIDPSTASRWLSQLGGQLMDASLDMLVGDAGAASCLLGFMLKTEVYIEGVAE